MVIKGHLRLNSPNADAMSAQNVLMPSTLAA